MEGMFLKLISYSLIILGSLSTLFGLFPIIFLYPDKPFELTWYWVLFQDSDRWFWQLGIIVLMIGIAMVYKQKSKD